MDAGGVSLTVPYWHSGPDAERIVALLQHVVTIIEGATGLVAYDLQAEAPFLRADPAAAASIFDLVRRSFAETLPEARPPRWRRLFRRKP
jgi:hypothetical protein